MKTSKKIRSSLGFTLVELMVTLAMGLFLAFGLIRVFASSNESYFALSQAAEQIENGRYALQTIRTDLTHAGYYGEYAFANSAPTPTVLPDPCVITNPATTMRDALPFYIQGYNAPATSPISCIDDNNHLDGTDILVIRRVNTGLASLGALTGTDIYMQAIADPSSTTNPVLNTGADPTVFNLLKKDGITAAEVRKYIVRIYYVSPCSVPASGTVCGADADGGRPIPTLKRLDMAVNPTTNALEWRNETIAEGIENLQIDYGIDTLPAGLTDGVTDSFVTSPGVVNWTDVVTAQVYLLARNVKPSGGFTDTKTYNMGLAGNVTPGGNFHRHAFTAQVRLVNPAQRREAP